VQSTTRPLTLAGAGLAAVLALGACGAGSGSHGSMGGSGHGSTSSPTSAASQAGRAGDVMFAQMMVPHHEQAIEMADLALQNSSRSAEVTAMARQIKGAQDPEIETMNRWLRQWGASATASAGHGGHTSGMMTEEDMEALRAARGPAFDRLWLSMMVEHHRGAVAMAERVLDTTRDAEVKDLAGAVVTGQEQEIATMQEMLG
jgi:uncharacterized protein (DUF305 family)